MVLLFLSCMHVLQLNLPEMIEDDHKILSWNSRYPGRFLNQEISEDMSKEANLVKIKEMGG